MQTPSHSLDILGVSYRECHLAFEVPQPWAENVVLSESAPKELAVITRDLMKSQKHFAFTALIPPSSLAVKGSSWVLRSLKGSGGVHPYQVEHFLVPTERLIGELPKLGDATFRGKDSPFFHSLSGEDYLICTHNARDLCCGKFGKALYEDLADWKPGLRFWQSSHVGGHRMAPILIELSTLRWWGKLTTDLAKSLLQRTISFAQAMPHYRGCSQWQTQGMQLAERELLKHYGWDGIPDLGIFTEEGDQVCYSSPKHKSWQFQWNQAPSIEAQASCRDSEKTTVKQYVIHEVFRERNL